MSKRLKYVRLNILHILLASCSSLIIFFTPFSYYIGIDNFYFNKILIPTIAYAITILSIEIIKRKKLKELKEEFLDELVSCQIIGNGYVIFLLLLYSFNVITNTSPSIVAIKTGPKNSSFFILAYIVIIIVGTVIAYIKNGDADGNNFTRRFLVILWASTIRTIGLYFPLFVSIPLAIFYTLVFKNPQNPTLNLDPGGFVSLMQIIFIFALSARTISKIKDRDKPTKDQVTKSDTSKESPLNFFFNKIFVLICCTVFALFLLFSYLTSLYLLGEGGQTRKNEFLEMNNRFNNLIKQTEKTNAHTNDKDILVLKENTQKIEMNQETSQKYLETVDILEKNKRLFSSEEQQVISANAKFIKNIEIIQKQYNEAEYEFKQSNASNPVSAKSKLELEKMLKVTVKFQIASEYLTDYLVNSAAKYKMELDSTAISNEEKSGVLSKYNSGKIQDIQSVRIRGEYEKEFTSNLIDLIALLHRNWGTWQYDSIEKKMVFENQAILDQYAQLMKKLGVTFP